MQCQGRAGPDCLLMKPSELYSEELEKLSFPSVSLNQEDFVVYAQCSGD